MSWLIKSMSQSSKMGLQKMSISCKQVRIYLQFEWISLQYDIFPYVFLYFIQSKSNKLPSKEFPNLPTFAGLQTKKFGRYIPYPKEIHWSYSRSFTFCGQHFDGDYHLSQHKMSDWWWQLETLLLIETKQLPDYFPPVDFDPCTTSNSSKMRVSWYFPSSLSMFSFNKLLFLMSFGWISETFGSAIVSFFWIDFYRSWQTSSTKYM